MRIALFHDHLLHLGGAERVLFSLHKIFPQAPIFTLFYDKNFISRYLTKAEIIPSFFQKIPKIQKLHPWFKILLPVAVESLNFKNFDLVISSSIEFGHGILLKPETKLIVYYHSPSRLLWDRSNEYIKDFKKRKKSQLKISLIRIGQHFLRLWDFTAARRPDIIIANSKYIAQRIKKYYKREAKVIYPPVEINRGIEKENLPEDKNNFFSDYFLIVSQLYPHKNIDLAIAAFKLLPKDFKLIIIGEGPEYNQLKNKSKGAENIKLLGFIPDDQINFYYKNCLAYLICNEEDFGISPVEAMLFGKPVLAYKKGGAEETVIEGISGEFFENLSPDSLANSIKKIFEKIKSDYFSPLTIRKYAEKFSFEKFKDGILSIIENINKI